jgi:hypothetical protein
MADRDLTVAATFPQLRADVPPWGNAGGGFGESTVLKFHIDIDEIQTQGGFTIGSTDVLHLWDIPIGTEIRKVMWIVRTAATDTTSTVNCGDSDSAACFGAALALSAADVVGGSAVTTDAYAIVGGRLYKAANILHMTFATAAPAGAVFDVYVYATMLQPEERDI